jgi:hypothetical protein
METYLEQRTMSVFLCPGMARADASDRGMVRESCKARTVSSAFHADRLARVVYSQCRETERARELGYGRYCSPGYGRETVHERRKARVHERHRESAIGWARGHDRARVLVCRTRTGGGGCARWPLCFSVLV